MGAFQGVWRAFPGQGMGGKTGIQQYGGSQPDLLGGTESTQFCSTSRGYAELSRPIWVPAALT